MLEQPDEYISLRRAADLAGLTLGTIRRQASSGRLQIHAVGRERLTTRRWLHAYLTQASENDKGTRKPLPADYVVPE